MRETFVPDSTAITNFRQCPEMARLRHHLGCEREREEGAEIDGKTAGSAWHAAMQCWFTEYGNAQSIETALAALRAAWPEEPLFLAKPAKRTLAHFEALLEGYAERWPREQDPFKVLRNEEYFEGYIANLEDVPFHAFPYCGIQDRKIRFEDGTEYVMDSKTTSGRLDDNYFADYELDQQLRGYMAWERVSGRPCAGVFVDVVHIDTRYHKVKPEFFDRRRIVYPDWKLSQWARDTELAIKQWETMKQELGIEQRWEQRLQGCRAWNVRCPFWARCNTPEEIAKDLPGYTYGTFWEPKNARQTS